ncbi:MAG: hypothetical protein ACN2B6_02860 [Rickettsiales bacterium]
MDKLDDELANELGKSQIDDIMSKLASARDPGDVRSLQGELASITLPHSSPYIAALSAAKDFAIKRLNEEEVSERLEEASLEGGTYPPSNALERAIFNYMTDEEKEYFQSIDPNKTYDVVVLDDDGEIVRDENGEAVTREVDGTTLRRDIVNITRESLSPEEQRKVDEEVKSAGEEKEPKERSEELEELEESLDNVEAKKATEIEEARKEGRISEEEAQEKRQDNRERFREAKERVREARKARREEEKHRDNAQNGAEAEKPMAEIMEREKAKEAEAKEEEMRESLQEVREVIAEKPEQKREPRKHREHKEEKTEKTEISQGEQADRAGHGLENVAAAKPRQTERAL